MIEQINNRLNGTIIKMFNQSNTQDQESENQDNNDVSNADMEKMKCISDLMRP